MSMSVMNRCCRHAARIDASDEQISMRGIQSVRSSNIVTQQSNEIKHLLNTRTTPVFDLFIDFVMHDTVIF